MEIENPYYETVNNKAVPTENGFKHIIEYPGRSGYKTLRNDLIRKYSYSIPIGEAITKISEYSPLLEIGGGNGYWAWMLKQCGTEIVSTDIEPADDCWTNVKQMGASKAVRTFTNRNLLMCWPQYDAEWPLKAVQKYQGNTVVYIGTIDSQTRYTGSEKLHSHLMNNYTVEEIVDLPSWEGMDDSVFIFTQ